MNPKKYNNIKLAISISKGIATFILLFLFVAIGFSLKLELFLGDYFSGSYLLFVVFVLAVGFAGSIIFFPVSYYSEYYLEHKNNLSNQSFLQWIWEDLKGLLVSLVIGIPILLIFFFSLNKFGNMWWLPFAVILFLVSVILARLVPVIILPLFYKIIPLEDEDLKSRIKILAEKAGIKVENVYKFDMSKNTKKANAAFTGLGKSKRILLGDTLIENYTADEIETVIAHELGHYKKKHIIKNLFIGTVSSFLMLFLIAYLYRISIGWFDFKTITQIAALPLLSMWAMLVGIVLTPVTNVISRKFEYEADEYAVIETGKKQAFIDTLEKLTDQNMGDKEPHPFVEWFFYSHPSIKNRISAINKISSSGQDGKNRFEDNLKFEGN